MLHRPPQTGNGRTAHDRRGFTIIELLVVLVIIGILLAITIPAVQSARESARRTTCLARLGEIGKAIHGFESARRTYPGAYVTFTSGGTTSAVSWSPQAQLLAYLEQSARAARIDFRNQPQALGSFDPANLVQIPEYAGSIESFLCPTDSNQCGGREGNNYRFCMGTGPGYVARPPETQGAFVAHRNVTSAEITDGLSTTIGVSEKLTGSAGGFSARTDAWGSKLATLLGASPSLDQMIQTCGSLAQAKPSDFYPYGGAIWSIADYNFTWYNHAVGPNAPVTDCSSVSFPKPLLTVNSGGVYKANSYHSGGVNSMLMDGSARFVADSIDLDVWRALGTRAGKESVDLGEDW